MKMCGQTDTRADKGFDLFGTVCRTKLVQLPGAAYSVYAPFHSSPFIMLHMGDTGPN